MGEKSKKKEDSKIVFLFLIIPTIFLILSYYVYPYPATEIAVNLIQIPMFLSLVLLGIGFFIKNQNGKKIKILGWLIFAFYWSTQPEALYLSEDGDIFNAVVCIIGVYVLSYIAYHEWLSIKREENISCLNWIAGATFIAGMIYFGVERTPLELLLRQVVAAHSGWFLKVVTGGNVMIGGDDNLNIFYNNSNVYLIFACTAVQAMVVFVGMILPLPNVKIKRKIYGLLVTVVPVYILNFMRNALVAFLVGNEITDFNMAHNVIAKIGALITLIVLLFILIKIIPEVLDEISCVIDLPKRKGPLEKIFWSKKT